MRFTMLPSIVCLAVLFLPAVAPLPGPSALGAGLADEPTPEEQYMFELIQRCRADPDGEAASFGIDLNEGLAPGTLPSGARQPLAFNFALLAAARGHCQDLIDNFPSLPTNHNGSDGRTPKQRMTDAGADTSGWTAENIGWTSKDGNKVTRNAMKAMHKTLFVDTVDASRGHRKTLVFGTLNEAGIGALGGNFASKKRSVCTEDFISTGSLYIVGVAYADYEKDDGFFTPGEELPGLTITAASETGGGQYATTTWRSGGYNVVVPPDSYTVTADGPGLIGTLTRTGVVVSTQNVKVDFLGPDPDTIPPPPAFELIKAKGKKRSSTGQWRLKVKKTVYTPGFLVYTGDLSDLVVLVDGDEYFAAAERANQAVKTKTNDAGEITKITIKDGGKNKLKLDLRKTKMKLTLKTAPGLDPTFGTVTIRIDLGGSSATLTAVATISGSRMNKVKLEPVVGTVVDL